LGTIFLYWFETSILQTSASQLARIIGMNHWCLVTLPFHCHVCI
jgi:hypothetical protein